MLYDIDDIFDDLVVGFGKNSWVLKKPLSECHSLFQDEDDAMEVYGYACKCGLETIIITNKYLPHVYSCERCKNSLFYEVDRFHQSINIAVNIDLDQKFSIDNNIAKIEVYIRVPLSINLSRDSIESEDVHICTKSIHLIGGETVHNEKNLTPDMDREISFRLMKYIKEEYLSKKLIGYRNYLDEYVTYGQLSHCVGKFLKYHKLDHAEFIRWKLEDEVYHALKNEKTPEAFLDYISSYKMDKKSIKRTLYQRYKNEITGQRFDSITPYVVCGVFDDPNIICSLLGDAKFSFMPNIAPDSYIDYSSQIVIFIRFLLRYYNQKRVFEMLKKTNPANWVFYDSLFMYQNLHLHENFIRTFNAPRANMGAIHNELVRCSNIIEYTQENTIFQYQEEQKKPCVVWGNKYEIGLPVDTNELNRWSNILKNCLYIYTPYITSGVSLVYGIKIEGALTYAIEISANKIEQFLGKHNAKPPEDAILDINLWFRHYFIDRQNLKKSGIFSDGDQE